MEDLAERARLNDAVVARSVERAVVTLIADLEDLAALPGRVAHPLAAGDVPAHHLFAQHVLAGLEAADDEVGMGPQGRRAEHRLDVFFLEHLPVVGVVRRRRLRGLFQHVVGAAERGGIDVGERYDRGELGIEIRQQGAALGADADTPDPHRSAPDRALERAGGAERGECRGAGQRLEEIAPADGHLLWREVHGIRLPILTGRP